MGVYTDIYLVDCENVGCRYLNIRNKTSRVYYFISGGRMSWGSFDLSNRNHSLIIAEHAGGKDALDFCIDGYLGFLICHYGKKVCYHIVSKDRGFLSMEKFFGGMGYNVCVDTDILQVKWSIETVGISISSLEERKLKVIYPLSFRLRRKLHNIYINWDKTRKSSNKTVERLNRQLIVSLTKNGVSKDLFGEICDVVRLSGGDIYILSSNLFSEDTRRELKDIYKCWTLLSDGDRTILRLEMMVLPVLLAHSIDTSISRGLCEELVTLKGSC